MLSVVYALSLALTEPELVLIASLTELWIVEIPLLYRAGPKIPSITPMKLLGRYSKADLSGDWFMYVFSSL